MENDVPLTIAIAEYELLREARRVSFDGSGKRFNFYVTMVAVTPAALSLIVQAVDSKPVRFWLSGAVLMTLCSLGAFTFVRLIHFDFWSAFYTRGLNRLRAYFLSRAPELKTYFVLPPFDDRPTFADFISLSATCAFVNSSVFAVSVGLAVGEAFRESLTLGVVGGSSALIVSLVAQTRFLKQRRRSHEEAYVKELRGKELFNSSEGS